MEKVSDELVAGRELDALMGETFGFEPRLSWQILNADESATAMTCDTEREAREWFADKLQRFPDSWLKDYHVGAWKRWPRFSQDDGAAMRLVEKLKADEFWPSMNWKAGVIPGDWNRAVWFVRFRCVRGGTRGDHWAYDESLPLAICKAACEVSKALAGGVAAPAAT